MAPPAPLPSPMSASPVSSQLAAASEGLVRQQLAAIRARTQRLSRDLGIADTANTAGKRVSKIFSLWYGPIHEVVPHREAAGTGVFLLAPLVSTDQFALPVMGKWHVGREGAFEWVDTNVFAYENWSFTALPAGGGVVGPVNPNPQGGLFASVLEGNGGGVGLQNYHTDYAGPGAVGSRPHVSFDFDFYNKREGRGLANARVSGQMFAGLTRGYRSLGGSRRLDVDTEIEPRLYVTECRMGISTTATAVYNVSQVSVYLNLVVRGYTVLE